MYDSIPISKINMAILTQEVFYKHEHLLKGDIRMMAKVMMVQGVHYTTLLVSGYI